MNTLRIGNQEYHLPEVLIYVQHRSPLEDGLMFSLYADSDDLKRAGFAIHCIHVPGAARLDYLEFELSTDSTEPLNELAESVICRPGAVLDLNSLRLLFGPVRYGVVPITLEALCQTRRKPSIRVRGHFDARVMRVDPPAEPST